MMMMTAEIEIKRNKEKKLMKEYILSFVLTTTFLHAYKYIYVFLPVLE